MNMKGTEIQGMSVHGDNEVVGRETDIEKETKYNKITLVGNCSQKAKDKFDKIIEEAGIEHHPGAKGFGRDQK